MSESVAPPECPDRLAAGAAWRQADAGAPDAWRRAGLARGRLHELFAAEPGDAGAAAGMALALAVAAGALPLLWLRIGAAERAAGRPSGAGAAELGIDPAALLLAVVPDEAALLRAAAEAGRCAGLGTLLVEAWGPAPGLDLTASRRLMLAAEASGVTVMVVRIAARPVPSAAASRWGVAALPSAALAGDAPGDPAPGAPAFLVECLRRRGGPAGQRWRVEWNRESRSFRPAEHVIKSPGDRRAPLSGAGLPLAADRAVALDPPASVRRAG